MSVTLSDTCSDINTPNEHLPSDSERQIALISRLDLAYDLVIGVKPLGLDDNRPCRPHVQCCRFSFAACESPEKCEGNEYLSHAYSPGRRCRQ